MRFVVQPATWRPSLAQWVGGLPGLSGQARRLLLEGDLERRYTGRTAGDGGYRMTMALAVAVSQPGREWTFAQWWEALVLRPTAGGAWARSLRSRKGERYFVLCREQTGWGTCNMPLTQDGQCRSAAEHLAAPIHES